MRIGIMGAPTNSENLGCVALTYSLISVLQQISHEINEPFFYSIFEWKEDKKSVYLLTEQLGIDVSLIQIEPYVLLHNPIKMAYHTKEIFQMIRGIKKCDCIIDLTEGDSFSDIYGDRWFIGRTNVKLIIEKLGVPLMLGPQTYGPFLKTLNQKKAFKAIKKASCVITRDLQSQKYILEETGIHAEYTTDLAFVLPYTKQNKSSIPVRVGINISKLLSADGNEVGKKNFTLTTDYSAYIDSLIEYLHESNYEIHLIPHVALDHDTHKQIKEKYQFVHLDGPFVSPVEVKNKIASMDIFIGARMHGTIAAFTSGVACIPTAYSPKFSSLFESVDYNILIDLSKDTTEQAIEKTIQYISTYQDIQKQIAACKIKYEENVQKLYTSIKKWLLLLKK